MHVHPVTNGTNVCVAINKRYQGHAKQVAAALWGSGAASWRYKNVIVTDDDIDISNYEHLDWAIAYRVNAGKDDIVVFPGSFGSPADPSTPLEERDVGKLGSGIWNRVLIDATRTWMYDPKPEWGGRFPPTVHPAPEDEAPGGTTLVRIRMGVDTQMWKCGISIIRHECSEQVSNGIVVRSSPCC